MILGIDYGEAKTGLAICEGKLAEPLVVIKGDGGQEIVRKIKKVAEENGVERIVVGVSEGEMAKRQKTFGLKLSEELNLPVEFFDETLTTKDAQRKAIEAGIKRKKRKEMEDAYAAAIMLQGWVDGQE